MAWRLLVALGLFPILLAFGAASAAAHARSKQPPTTPYCGDGVIEPGEQCDDGDANSDAVPDACRTNCTRPRCGDGVVDSGEECDNGRANSNIKPDACRLDCTLARCGDGVVDSGEQCDGSFLCSHRCVKLSLLAYYHDLPPTWKEALWGTVAVLVFLCSFHSRGTVAGLFRRAVTDKTPAGPAPTIDDIPLAEIEKPWHD